MGRDHRFMSTTARIQRRYVQRLREVVRSTGNIEHASRRGVPRSTARRWLTSAGSDVVTMGVFEIQSRQLEREVLVLRRRVEPLVARLRIVVVLVKVSCFSLDRSRLPARSRKVALLRAIDRSHSVLPLRIALRLLRLSSSRYHLWVREDECGLGDMDSCPRSSPGQLTRAAVTTVEEMVTSDEYRHIPTGTLAILAQRLGKVFASPSTWHRLVRLHEPSQPSHFRLNGTGGGDERAQP